MTSVMQRLYDSEINAKIEWLWDGRFDVSLGDVLNGWKATNTVDTWAEVEVWLTAKAIEHYPDSKFARDEADRHRAEAVSTEPDPDVFALEPMSGNPPVYRCKICGLTPEQVWASGHGGFCAHNRAADHSHDSGEFPRR